MAIMLLFYYLLPFAALLTAFDMKPFCSFAGCAPITLYSVEQFAIIGVALLYALLPPAVWLFTKLSGRKSLQPQAEGGARPRSPTHG
jgi:hypothetical protein